MKKIFCSLIILQLFFFLRCTEPKEWCQDTAFKRSAEIAWDKIPNYEGRGCKVEPARNPASPLWKAAIGRPNAGLVYVKIEILDECKNDNWYSYFYYNEVWGYHDEILIPVNKTFKLSVKYDENCLMDCYRNELSSAEFTSEKVIDPIMDWPPGVVYKLPVPEHAPMGDDYLVCH